MVQSKLTSQQDIKDRVKGFEAELASLADRNNAFVKEAQGKLTELDQRRQQFIEQSQKTISDNQAAALRLEGTINGLKGLLTPQQKNGTKPAAKKKKN